MNQALVDNIVITRPSTSQKPKLIYGYDTLCGWCYGFSEELKKAINLLQDDIDFELVNGGLFAGIRGPKMGYMSAYIRRNMKTVTERTGQKFGKGFMDLLDCINYPYNSMKASIAIEVIKELKPNKVFDFAENIQKAFFEEGKDIQSDNLYLSLIDDYNLDINEFLECLNSEYYEKKAQKSFLKIQDYGFGGYPASALKVGRQVKVLTEGFVTAEELSLLVRQELNK